LFTTWLPQHFITQVLRVLALEYGNEILIAMHGLHPGAMNIHFLYLAKIIAQLVGKTHGLKKVQAISVLRQWNLIGGLVWIHLGVVALTTL
jgi:hypothetical protein